MYALFTNFRTCLYLSLYSNLGIPHPSLFNFEGSFFDLKLIILIFKLNFFLLIFFFNRICFFLVPESEIIIFKLELEKFEL